MEPVRIEELPPVPLPVEPLYGLRVACELVPFRTMATLYHFLEEHKEEFPPRYTKLQGIGTRMLTGAEIRRMREMIIVDDGTDQYHTKAFLTHPRRPKKPTSPIAAIMQRAMHRA